MSEENAKTDQFGLSGKSPPIAPRAGRTPGDPFSDPVALSKEQEKQLRAEKKQNRTLGLRAFDVLLYPILTNFVIFFMSVGATYMTRHGNELNSQTGKAAFGKIGEFFQRRGNAVKKFFRNFGASENAATNANMVFWSFFDGTLIAPFVKLFEDRREKIGNWIDDRLGTTADDRSVYEAEPKQTWGSVVWGRILASALVIPAAVILEKTGWNEKFFTKPGKDLGAHVETKMPRLTSFLGKFQPRKLFPVALFEAFYTSLCTTGLYFFSRALAKKPEHTAPIPEHIVRELRPLEPDQEAPAQASAPATDKPTTTVSHAAAQQRLDAAQQMAPAGV